MIPSLSWESTLELGMIIYTAQYPGWCGMLYDRSRYEYRGKFAETRFKRDCLAEYAEVFKTVCVNAAYYTFPSQQYLEGMVGQTPDDFVFGLKVTDATPSRNTPTLTGSASRPGSPTRTSSTPRCS